MSLQGFYIHNCEKMRYKAEYSPSELLCPITFTWHDISKCTEMLDKFEFTPLDKTLAERRSAMGVDASSTELSSLYKQRYTKGDELKLALSSPHLGDFTLEDLSPRSRQFLMPILSQWIELVGMDAAIKIKVIFP